MIIKHDSFSQKESQKTSSTGIRRVISRQVLLIQNSSESGVQASLETLERFFALQLLAKST